MKHPILQYPVLLLLFCLSACAGEDSVPFLRKFFDTVYNEKRPQALFYKMTENMVEEVQQRQLGIFSSKERLAEKYPKHHLINITKKRMDDRLVVYGLIKQISKYGGESYRTFLAKFIHTRPKQGPRVWTMYDMVVEQEKRIKAAQGTIALLQLSPQAEQVLKKLPRKVNILAFDTGTTDVTSHLLKEIAVHNPEKIELKFLNPLIERGTAESYGIKRPGFIIVEQGNLRYRIKKDDLIFQKKKEDAREKTHFQGERVLIMAMHRVASEDNRLYYVTGMGEKSIVPIKMKNVDDTNYHRRQFKSMSQLYGELNYFGFQVSTNNLSTPQALKKKPILLFAAPTRSISSNMQATISNYLFQGGRILFMFEKPLPRSFRDMLAGLQLKSYSYHTILDPMYKDFIGGPAWFRAEILNTPATVNFHNRFIRYDPEDGRTIYFRGMITDALGMSETTNTPHPYYKITRFMQSSTNSWAERKYKPSEPDEATFSKYGDVWGPICVGYVVQGLGKGKARGRALIYGDCDFVSDLHFITRVSNWHLFRETLNWLYNPRLAAIKPRLYDRDQVL